MPAPVLALCGLARAGAPVALWPSDPRLGVVAGRFAGLDEFFNIVLRDAVLEAPGDPPVVLPLVLVRADSVALVQPREAEFTAAGAEPE